MLSIKKYNIKNNLFKLKNKDNYFLLTNFLLGMPIGITFVLIMSSSQIRFLESGATKTIIGLFALLHLPHLLKFMISALFDIFKIPVIHKCLNRTTTWILIIQLSLIATINMLGFIDFNKGFVIPYFLLLVASFLGASQEVFLDGYRILITNEKSTYSGTSIYVLGYRIGTIIGGAGMLYVSIFSSWKIAYLMASVFIFLSLLFILKSQMHLSVPMQLKNDRLKYIKFSFYDFTKRKGWICLALFVFFLKFTDNLMHIMSNSFCFEMGFTKLDIANAAKFMGMISIIMGGVIGGALVKKKGLYKTFILGWFLHIFSSIIIPVQIFVEKNLLLFYMSIAFEYFANGISNVTFVIFITTISANFFGRTQYAILTSIWAFGVICSGIGGWFAEYAGWGMFFSCVIALEIPTVFLFYMLSNLHEYNTILKHDGLELNKNLEKLRQNKLEYAT